MTCRGIGRTTNGHWSIARPTGPPLATSAIGNTSRAGIQRRWTMWRTASEAPSPSPTPLPPFLRATSPPRAVAITCSSSMRPEIGTRWSSCGASWSTSACPRWTSPSAGPWTRPRCPPTSGSRSRWNCRPDTAGPIPCATSGCPSCRMWPGPGHGIRSRPPACSATRCASNNNPTSPFPVETDGGPPTSSPSPTSPRASNASAKTPIRTVPSGKSAWPRMNPGDSGCRRAART